MIRITLLSGQFAGRTREFTLGDVEPHELFTAFIGHGDHWQVDYTAGTEEEVFLWFRAELVARILRALKEGRPVSFLDRRWQVAAGDNLTAIAGEVEDAIVASGRLVTLDSDNESGLVIGVRGWES